MPWESVACCDECWVKRQGGRTPYRFRQEARVLEYCHYCGWTTYSGIYVRENTDDTPAAGLRVRKEEGRT